MSAYEELAAALADPLHMFNEVPLTSGIIRPMRQIVRAEVPDMPDRLIAATAAYLRVPIISRDRRIRATGLDNIW